MVGQGQSIDANITEETVRCYAEVPKPCSSTEEWLAGNPPLKNPEGRRPQTNALRKKHAYSFPSSPPPAPIVGSTGTGIMHLQAVTSSPPTRMR
jgi:hypothetical protein